MTDYHQARRNETRQKAFGQTCRQALEDFKLDLSRWLIFETVEPDAESCNDRDSSDVDVFDFVENISQQIS